MTRLAIDAMSGDEGSAVVVGAVQKFHQEYPEIALTVVGKEEELTAIRGQVDHYKIEGDLRREVSLNIKRLTEIYLC